jgi:copper chaperone CopZ
MSVPTSVHELSAPSHVTIDIVGMTCASCVRRVEKALSRVEGVQIAEVNLATEAATVAFDPAVVTLDHLSAAVGKAGYTASQRAAAAVYRLWGQFRTADGTVITTRFTVVASDPASE